MACIDNNVEKTHILKSLVISILIYSPCLLAQVENNFIIQSLTTNEYNFVWKDNSPLNSHAVITHLPNIESKFLSTKPLSSSDSDPSEIVVHFFNKSPQVILSELLRQTDYLVTPEARSHLTDLLTRNCTSTHYTGPYRSSALKNFLLDYLSSSETPSLEICHHFVIRVLPNSEPKIDVSTIDFLKHMPNSGAIYHEAKTVVLFPIDLIAKLSSREINRTLQLYLNLPENMSEQQILKASEYFGSLLSPSEAEVIIRKNLNSRKLNIVQFLPKEVRGLINQRDLNRQFNCHSFAFFATHIVARKSGVRFCSCASSRYTLFEDNKNYYRPVTDGPLRFGDIIQFGKLHFVVYLVDGYVLQKDDVGLPWGFRIVHLDDILNAESRKMDLDHLYSVRPDRVYRPINNTSN